MEKIIEEMIWRAWRHRDYEMAAMAYKIMGEFAVTINCPSNWRSIGEKMAKKFKGNAWIEENCVLSDFE